MMELINIGGLITKTPPERVKDKRMGQETSPAEE
jgi:hypothetical protein